MTDEIRAEDEVEAHGPLAGAAADAAAAGPTFGGPTLGATDDEPDVEAHGPLGMGPEKDGPAFEGPTAG